TLILKLFMENPTPNNNETESEIRNKAAQTASEEAAKKEKKKESWWDVLKFALITLVIVIPVRLYIAQPFIVSGDSMYPTFHDGEYLIVDELSYNFRPIERGDVVIFHYPVDPSKYFIKRVIGLPGETVTVTGGKVFISSSTTDQFKLSEPYLKQITAKDTNTKIGPDEYFVMGDNRSVSFDSRYWGPVAKKLVRGRAIFRLFPPTKLAYFPGEYHNYIIK
ncbi:MAG: signal peptidase I, partial [Candidatus Vogelbacteria bacterium]|nr:signal peptidase I [Candidatus Vogelbacteria bacterium]